MSTTTNKPWTVERVRDELPDVRVKAFGEVLPGRVGGRLNRFASVDVPTFGGWVSFKFAWSTVARALNTNAVLDVGHEHHRGDPRPRVILAGKDEG